MRANGITGWRRGSKLTGKPDFIFPKLESHGFVDGLFSSTGVRYMPHGRKNRAAFWLAKLTGNKAPWIGA